MDDLDGQGYAPPAVRVCRLVFHPLLTLLATACFLNIVGWTGHVSHFLHWSTLVLGLAFAFQRLWVYFRHPCVRTERRRLATHAGLALAVGLLSVSLLFQTHDQGRWSYGSHLAILLFVLLSGLASMIHHQARVTARAFHPGLVLILSFLAIIVVGTLLLRMPRCTVSGLSCSWLDAAFTSTSSVCVTGLCVQNTATYFSTTGQTIILILVQIGGLGIMTLTFFAAVILFEGISLHDRLLLGRMIQENRLARINRTLLFIVLMTAACETVGAFILYFSFDAIPDPAERAFHAVFHSVSAFCNAGFSTFPDNLASSIVHGNATWQVAIMVLIVIGGLGAVVCEDVCLWIIARLRLLRTRHGLRPRLRIHSRLVLVATAILVFGGAAVIYLTEFHAWNGPANGGALLTSLFHSVATRTAGFNTVPMNAVGLLTIQAMMILMLIGGSPGGTAGGLRTTTIAVALGHLWNLLRGGSRGLVAFHRRIPDATGAQALGLIVLTGIWLTANLIVLQIFEAGRGISETKLLFELIGAFATAGFTIDLTPALTDSSKKLLILNMFVGRIGLLTVLATFIPPDSRPPSGKPCENILLT